MCGGQSPEWTEGLLDDAVLALFRRWRELLDCFLDEEEIRKLDLRKAFCSDVLMACDRLIPELRDGNADTSARD